MRFSRLMLCGAAMAGAMVSADAGAVTQFQFEITGAVSGVQTGYNRAGDFTVGSFTKLVDITTPLTNSFDSYLSSLGNYYSFSIQDGNASYGGSFLYDSGTGAIAPITLTYNYLSVGTCLFGTPGICTDSGTTDKFTVTRIGVPAAVPEPATWAMLLIGFGAIGFAMRRKHRQQVAVRYA